MLSTFVYEPIRWNARFGWRNLSPAECTAMFHFWREVGRRMNIKNIPNDSAAFETFNQDYERKHYRFTDANHRVGLATRNLFMSWFPSWTHPLARRAIHAMMDEPLLEAFGFEKPSAVMRSAVNAALRARSLMLRFLPRRKKPLLRNEMKPRSYPNGYRIEDVGPKPSP